jgi:hypothetical protein
MENIKQFDRQNDSTNNHFTESWVSLTVQVPTSSSRTTLIGDAGFADRGGSPGKIVSLPGSFGNPPWMTMRCSLDPALDGTTAINLGRS